MRVLKLLEGLYQELKTYNEQNERMLKKDEFKNDGFRGRRLTFEDWVYKQLNKREITLGEIASKNQLVKGIFIDAIKGIFRAPKHEKALCEALGYISFEAMVNAYWVDMGRASA